jgi:hypothetical protein
MAIGRTHDFSAFTVFGFPDPPPPFLAGTKVPSTKHSFRFKWPASWRCCAKAGNTCSMAPVRTQRWESSMYGLVRSIRGGRTCQGVARTQDPEDSMMAGKGRCHGCIPPKGRRAVYSGGSSSINAMVVCGATEGPGILSASSAYRHELLDSPLQLVESLAPAPIVSRTS